MHDRYMYPLFPLLAVFIGLTKHNKFYIVSYLLLSIFHFINLLYSWIPTYFPFFWMYQVIYSRTFDWILSMLISMTAAVLYFKSFRLLHAKSSDTFDKGHLEKEVKNKELKKLKQ